MMKVVMMVVLVTALVGCTTKSSEIQKIMDSPITVEADYEPGTDFKQFKTWNWVPQPQMPGHDPRTGDLELTKIIQEAVGGEMFSRGFKRADSEYDLIANFHVALNTIDQDYINEYYKGEYPQYKMDMTGTKDDKEMWSEGTLILFFFDAKDGQLVWRGSAQAEVTEGASLKQRDARVKRAIKMMFDANPGIAKTE